jgi:hypothetical protein
MLPDILLYAEMKVDSLMDPRELERARLLSEFAARGPRRPGLARRLLGPRIYALGVLLERTGASLAAEPQPQEY